MDLIRSMRALARAWLPNRGGQEMTRSKRRSVWSGIGRQNRRAHDAEPGWESDLFALPTAHDGHAPSAVGRGHQRDCPMARA